jgi:hypothetical protein
MKAADSLMGDPAMRKSSSLAAMVLVFSIVLAAQDALSGKWEGVTNAGATLVLDLTAKGATLTGTLTRDGHSSPLSDGKVSEKTFAFKAELNDQTEAVSGELAGDEIKVWLDRQGPERAIVLKRVTRK